MRRPSAQGTTAGTTPIVPTAMLEELLMTRGLSLISTGRSGAGTCMCAYAWQFYGLHRLTGERHFLAVSRSLLYNIKQMTDSDGTLGYATMRGRRMPLATRHARRLLCRLSL